MLRGPMFASKGRGSNLHSSENSLEFQMNMGGPSESTCNKKQAAYTTESGVIKWLAQAQLAFCAHTSATETKPLLETNKIKVIPCALANDGTALKPAIEYDPRQEVNVGLTVPVDAVFVKENPEPSPDFLKSHVITEAVVSSVTTLDNNSSLPVAVEYKGKSEKTGSDMKSLILNQCKLLQIREACLSTAKTCKLVVKESCLVELCVSCCNECSNINGVCDACTDNGQVTHIPSLRACESCIEKGIQCIRRCIMVFTTDCEKGINRQCWN